MVEVEGTKQFSSRAVVCYVKANLLCEPPRVVAEDAGDSFSHFGGALTFLTGDFAFFFFQPSEKLLSGFYTESHHSTLHCWERTALRVRHFDENCSENDRIGTRDLAR